MVLCDRKNYFHNECIQLVGHFKKMGSIFYSSVKEVILCVGAEISRTTYSLALSKIPKIGCTIYKRLIDQFGQAQKIFKIKPANQKCPKPLNALHQVNKIALLNEAKQIEQAHKENGVSIVSYEDEEYPSKLRHIFNPPSILYKSGSLDFNQARIVGIVGTRDMTSYGKKFTEKLVEELSKYNVVLVSGLAYGVDICAHVNALLHRIPNIAVLAGGVDVIYPAQHTKEVAAIKESGGCVISEQPLGVQPDRHLFPMRNRIIAGLVDALIVVEAGEKSGALITAKYANAFNREVFALPGDVHSNYSTGCNYLIKTHQAHMLTGVEDLAYIMDWKQKSSIKQERVPLPPNLNHEESSVINILSQKDALHLDEIALATRINATKLAWLMLQLEMKSLISIMGGDKYSLHSSYGRGAIPKAPLYSNRGFN